MSRASLRGQSRSARLTHVRPCSWYSPSFRCCARLASVPVHRLPRCCPPPAARMGAREGGVISSTRGAPKLPSATRQAGMLHRQTHHALPLPLPATKACTCNKNKQGSSPFAPAACRWPIGLSSIMDRSDTCTHAQEGKGECKVGCNVSARSWGGRARQQRQSVPPTRHGQQQPEHAGRAP
mgnify:CR=1 FL=1